MESTAVTFSFIQCNDYEGMKVLHEMFNKAMLAALFWKAGRPRGRAHGMCGPSRWLRADYSDSDKGNATVVRRAVQLCSTIHPPTQPLPCQSRA